MVSMPLATGISYDRVLDEAHYIPAWLEPEEQVQAFEVGYRALSWMQDVSPFESNDPEDVRAFIAGL